MAFLRRKLRPAIPPVSRGVPARPEVAPRGADGRPTDDRRPPRAVDPSPLLEDEVTTPSGDADVGDDDAPHRILVVCTANICRSPLAEGLLRHALRVRGVPAVVRSAGLVSSPLSVDPRSVRFAAQVGDDLSGHRPRQLSTEIIRNDGADLVLTMGREHLREVANIDPPSLRRTFTLREFGRRVAGNPVHPDEVLATWIARLGAGRRAADLLGDNTPDDILDPYGRPDHVFQSVATEIHELVSGIATATALALPDQGGR